MSGRFFLCYFLVIVVRATFGQEVDPCGPQQPRIIDARSHRTGYIYSPGYEKKQNYPDFAQCSHQIYTFSGWHVVLKFNDMDIEVADACQSDAIHIYDFNSQGRSVLKATLCGSYIPRDMISNGTHIHVSFSSNVYNTKRGYNISYSTTSSPELCPSTALTCRNRNCVAKHLKCDGKDDCGDGTDEEKCGHPVAVQDCGNPAISPLSAFDRIVGGKEVTPGSWPWMADLQQSVVEPCGHVCGGALINAQWVLSAAHCFGVLRRPEDWRIHLGNHDKFKIEPQEQIRRVERIIIYYDIPSREFESNGQYDITHDLAMVKLNAPVNITTYVRPICLPQPGTELAAMTECYATGWGVTRGTGSSNALKQALHPIQPDAICQRIVGSQFNPPSMICAGSLQPRNGVCHGDSGGPLVCKINKKWSIFGVASYVTDGNYIEGLCGLKNRPSVFNKVAAKISWISNMLTKYAS